MGLNYYDYHDFQKNQGGGGWGGGLYSYETHCILSYTYLLKKCKSCQLMKAIHNEADFLKRHLCSLVFTKLAHLVRYNEKKNVFGKGQMKSECIYKIFDFPKYHQKHLIDFCPEFRLGMLCTHLIRVAL